MTVDDTTQGEGRGQADVGTSWFKRRFPRRWSRWLIIAVFFVGPAAARIILKDDDSPERVTLRYEILGSTKSASVRHWETNEPLVEMKGVPLPAEPIDIEIDVGHSYLISVVNEADDGTVGCRVSVLTKHSRRVSVELRQLSQSRSNGPGADASCSGEAPERQ